VEQAVAEAAAEGHDRSGDSSPPRVGDRGEPPGGGRDRRGPGGWEQLDGVGSRDHGGEPDGLPVLRERRAAGGRAPGRAPALLVWRWRKQRCPPPDSSPLAGVAGIAAIWVPPALARWLVAAAGGRVQRSSDILCRLIVPSAPPALAPERAALITPSALPALQDWPGTPRSAGNGAAAAGRQNSRSKRCCCRRNCWSRCADQPVAERGVAGAVLLTAVRRQGGRERCRVRRRVRATRLRDRAGDAGRAARWGTLEELFLDGARALRRARCRGRNRVRRSRRGRRTRSASASGCRCATGEDRELPARTAAVAAEPGTLDRTGWCELPPSCRTSWIAKGDHRG
jgi:hypothetical protein